MTDKNRSSLIDLITYLLFYGIILGLIIILISQKILPWPFHVVRNLKQAYMTIGEYAPVLVLPILSLFWIHRAKLSLKDAFQWKFPSPITFLPGLILSLGYAGFILFYAMGPKRALPFWIPVIILSTVNSLTEEVVFRFTLFRLAKRTMPPWAANILQSTVYGIPHYPIGGLYFALFSFIYGLVLGLMTEKNESLVPAIICHIIIDMGCIGIGILAC